MKIVEGKKSISIWWQGFKKYMFAILNNGLWNRRFLSQY